MRDIARLWVWCMAAWLFITWTWTLEQVIVGACAALVVAVAVAPLAPVASPLRLANPLRLIRMAVMTARAAGRSVVANIGLARRVWTPSLPIRPGMVVVPTEVRTPSDLTAVGLVTSLIVDNQLVDLDTTRHQLQYHAVWIDAPDPAAQREQISGWLERALLAMRGDR